VPGAPLIDLISNAALEAMQAQKECFWLAAACGWEPTLTTTKTSRAVTKIVKRRIGRPPDGGYEGGVMNVPLNNTVKTSTYRAKLFSQQTHQNQ
jgi:hypothetical protein